MQERGIAALLVVSCVGCSHANTAGNDAPPTTTVATSTTTTTASPDDLTGQWIGDASNDGGLSDPDPCGEEDDLLLSIQQSGNTLSGSVIFTVRSYTNQTGICASLPPVGTQYRPSILNGTHNGNNVQFGATDQGYPPSAPGHTLPFSGTVDGSRMSGTACADDSCRWAVSRR
jgi:hypothetical protein